MKMIRLILFVVVSLLWMGSEPVQAGLKEIPLEAKKAHCQHPKFSPDGRYLAYEVRHVDKRVIELHILDLETNKTTIVQPSSLGASGLDVETDKRGMVARELAWAPQGFRYLFSSNGSGSVYDVYMSREGRLKSNSRDKNDGQPAWSPDGKRIVFTSARTGKGDLYMVNVGKLKPRQLTKNADSTEFFATWDPSNPRRLAYVRHTDQSDRIYVIDNVFSPSPKRLTSWGSSVSEVSPSWSPDGQHVAFYGVRSDGTADLYLGKVGEKPQRLASRVAKGDQYGPAWSPNGSHLFYVQKRGAKEDEIIAMRVSSKEKTKIATGTQLNNEISISKRGGKWQIAFTSQGQIASSEKVFRKLYIYTLAPL